MYSYWAMAADIQQFSRVDVSSLPDQTLMELLVADVNNIGSFRDDEGAFLEITRWGGLKFDDDGVLVEIRFSLLFSSFFRYGGTIALQYIPPSVQIFKIGKNQLEGECDTETLPRGLLTLSLIHNKLAGRFSVKNLPPSIELIYISDNLFCGPLNLLALPKTVNTFMADQNSFSGSLDFSALPLGLETLSLGSNKFDKDIDYSVVPEEIEGLLDTNDNAFLMRHMRLS